MEIVKKFKYQFLPEFVDGAFKFVQVIEGFQQQKIILTPFEEFDLKQLKESSFIEVFSFAPLYLHIGSQKDLILMCIQQTGLIIFPKVVLFKHSLVTTNDESLKNDERCAIVFSDETSFHTFIDYVNSVIIEDKFGNPIAVDIHPVNIPPTAMKFPFRRLGLDISYLNLLIPKVPSTQKVGIEVEVGGVDGRISYEFKSLD